MLGVGPLLAALAACASPPQGTQETTAVPTTTEGLTLTWRVERAAADRLEVHYTVKNDRDAAVWLLDRQLLWPPGTGVAEDPTRIQVRAPAAGHPLRLVRGWVAPDAFPQVELLPGARELAPGATAEGHAAVPLPPRTWHPNEVQDRAVAPVPDQVVLQVGVLLAPPTGRRKLVDGTEVPVPTAGEARKQLVLEGAPLPLPR